MVELLKLITKDKEIIYFEGDIDKLNLDDSLLKINNYLTNKTEYIHSDKVLHIKTVINNFNENKITNIVKEAIERDNVKEKDNIIFASSMYEDFIAVSYILKYRGYRVAITDNIEIYNN